MHMWLLVQLVIYLNESRCLSTLELSLAPKVTFKGFLFSVDHLIIKCILQRVNTVSVTFVVKILSGTLFHDLIPTTLMEFSSSL